MVGGSDSEKMESYVDGELKEVPYNGVFAVKGSK